MASGGWKGPAPPGVRQAGPECSADVICAGESCRAGGCTRDSKPVSDRLVDRGVSLLVRPSQSASPPVDDQSR